MIKKVTKKEETDEQQPTVTKTGESVNYGYHPIIDFFRFCKFTIFMLMSCVFFIRYSYSLRHCTIG